MKNVLIFLAGLATGAVGTLIYVRKCVVPAMRDEIAREESEREHADFDYSEYYDDSEVTETGSGTELPEKPKTKAPGKKLEAKADRVDYTAYSKEGDDKPEKKESLEDKYKLSADDGGFEPYVIDASEFEVNPNYTSHSFYYHSDGVVVDEDSGERLDGDPELIFGDTALRELEENGIVYVRDDTKKQEYVIEIVNAPYGTNIFDEPEG